MAPLCEACYIHRLLSWKISSVQWASKKGDTQVLSHASTPQLVVRVNACVFCQVVTLRDLHFAWMHHLKYQASVASRHESMKNYCYLEVMWFSFSLSLSLLKVEQMICCPFCHMWPCVVSCPNSSLNVLHLKSSSMRGECLWFNTHSSFSSLQYA